jgi:uncharacterized protein involved in exopolysaccharide biosynthesis
MNGPLLDLAETGLPRTPERPEGGVLGLVERRWRTVVGAGAIGLFVGALASFFLPRWYESTARLAVIPVEDPTASIGVNVIDSANAALPIEVAVLKSREIAGETVAQLKLESAYGTPTREAAIALLASHLTVTTDRKSNLITVSAEARTPAAARAIAETVCRVAAARTAALWAARNREQRHNLEAELADAGAKLRAAEEERRAFHDRTGIVDLPAQMRATVEAAAALQKRRIDKRLELHFARDFSTEDAVEVRRVSREHAATSRELASLRRRRAAPFLPLDALPALEAEEAAHKREIDQLSARYNLVSQKLAQLAAADARPGGRAEPIDPPSEPRPSRPSLIGLSAQGSALGALLGALYLILNHRRRALGPR